MSRRKNRNRWFNSQRLAGLGCLVGLAVVVAFGVVLYQQVRSLFQPPNRQPGGQMVGTEDAPVVRGSISDGIWAYGAIRPAREAELGFRLARGKVTMVGVRRGQQVRAGQLLVQLDPAPLESNLAKAKADLLAARRELEDLGSAAGDAPELRLQVELRDARAALDKARQELAAYDAGTGTPQEKRARAAADLAGAEAALAALRESSERREQIERLQWIYNQTEVKHGEMASLPNPSEKDRDVTWLLRNDMLSKREALDTAKLRYEMDIRAAERKVALARRQLQSLDREIALGSPAIERARLAAAVKSAEAAVQQAEARLTAFTGSVPNVELARAQANVLKREGAVADAEVALSEAKLVAPFDGLVDEVKVSTDMLISNSQPVVTVVDVSSLQIVAQISDIDVARLRPGLEVQLRFDSLRGQGPLPGRLGDIPPYATYEGGMTTFEVPISFDAGQLPLRPGMGANVYVPLAQRENVLLIPATAVQRDGEGAYVLVVRGKSTERRKVSLGASDGVNVEVLEGLSEGEVVRVPLQGPMSPKIYAGG